MTHAVLSLLKESRHPMRIDLNRLVVEVSQIN